MGSRTNSAPLTNRISGSSNPNNRKELTQPSPFFLPCENSCNPQTQFNNSGIPGVWPYCKAFAKRFPSIVIVFSDDQSSGERTLKEREVMGKVALLGLPAKREIRPGLASIGKRLRTWWTMSESMWNHRNLKKAYWDLAVWPWHHRTRIENSTLWAGISRTPSMCERWEKGSAI